MAAAPPPAAPPPAGTLLDLTGRTAVVTGAGAGLGAVIAERLAEAGAAISVHYRTNRAGALDVAARIAARGGRCLTCEADLTQPAHAERLFDTAAAHLGVPDILINNAGAYPLSSILDMSVAEWNLVVGANLTSTHLTTQALARRLVAVARPGAIVNIASIEASTGAPAHSHYQAAKAGVVAYTRAAARELGPKGLRVNAVSPGLIWRDGLDADWPDGVGRYTAAAPLGRLGTAADVADACLFLVAPAARWITGIELIVDGGVLTNGAY
jgi:NAD(P)-dependent dehydrogenase (short-subunit alcohol dehydrogenase family)